VTKRSCRYVAFFRAPLELLNTALEYTDDYADVYNLIGMEYLFMDNLEMAKQSFIKCLEEDLDDQSALYNVVVLSFRSKLRSYCLFEQIHQ
jgi:tetratricopeptide (TPR) repeat protein